MRRDDACQPTAALRRRLTCKALAVRPCPLVTRFFALLYAAALFLFAVGVFGWFGQAKDPLGAVFLAPLGLPWNLMLDRLPDSVLPWLGAAAPLLNLALLLFLCRSRRKRRERAAGL